MIVENWNEFLLFYHISNYNITSNTTFNVKRNRLCPFKNNMLEEIRQDKHIYFQYIWCDLLVEMININIFYKRVRYYIPKQYLSKKYQIIFYIYHQIFSKMLIVNMNIVRQVNKFISSFKLNKYIGIQIRVGNADLNEKQFSDIKDIEIMLNIASKQLKYKKWFLTGDSCLLKLKLSKMYKKIITFSYNKTNHYANHKRDSSIIVEHEILSRSSFLIISQSTYGLVAILKSGLLLNEVGSISFVIKRGRITNILKYFRNITSKWYM